MPKVSVIIPTYNSAHLVGQAIESVLAQSYRDFELIVVDDGSTDDTQQVLQSFSNKIRPMSQDHMGVAEARNTGIRQAQGEYIAFLDADDLWLPPKLKLQISLLEENSDTNVVYSDIYISDENGQITDTLRARHAGNILSHLLIKNVVVGSASTVILRKTCFVQAGYFDPALPAFEDWDLWLRLAKYFQFDFVPQPLTQIRRQSSSRTQTAGVQGHRQALESFYHQLRQDPLIQKALPVRSSHFVRAVVHMNIGNHLLMNFDDSAQQARQEFLKAIRLYPTLHYAYIGLLKSFLGVRWSYWGWRLKWKVIGLLHRSSHEEA